MSDIITTLHPENDEDTNLYPNIKKENIPNASIGRDKLDSGVNSLLNSINELHPAGVDTSSNILAYTTNKGIYIASNNGHWYYWNGTQYADGGVYQATQLADGSVTYSKLATDVTNELTELKLDSTKIFSNKKKIVETFTKTFDTQGTTYYALSAPIPSGTIVYYKLKNTGGTIYNISVSINSAQNEYSRDIIANGTISANSYGSFTTGATRKYLEIWKNGVQSSVSLDIELYYYVDNLYAPYIAYEEVNNIKNNIKTFTINLDINGTAGTQYIALENAIEKGTEITYHISFTGASTISDQALTLNKYQNESVRTNLASGFYNTDINGTATLTHDANYIELWRNATLSNLVYHVTITYSKQMYAEPYVEDDVKDNVFEIDNAKHRLMKLELLNDYYYDNDKAYIVLTIDDGNQYLPIIRDLCESKNVPLCPAIPYSTLNNTYSGESVREICEDIVNNGGEVLAHHTRVITENSTIAELIDQFKTTKYNFEENTDFNVRGYILAGGQGQIVRSPITDYYVRQYYDYSDLYGVNEPYYHPRYWYHDYTLNQVKSDIDSFIANKDFKVFAMHGSNNPSDLEYVDNFETILDYIISKGTENVEIVTWSYVYDNFIRARWKN